MKRSMFGEKLDELMRTTRESLTTSQMADEVGCSVQRAYAWVSSNKGELIAVGVDPTGGTLYLSRRNPMAKTAPRKKTDGGLEVGTELVITKIVLVGNGEARVELETHDGRMLEATVVI